MHKPGVWLGMHVKRGATAADETATARDNSTRKTGSLLPAIERAEQQLSAYSRDGSPPLFQLFVTGPHSPRPCITPEEVQEIGRRWPGQTIIHGAYIDNAWTPAAVSNIKRELRIASEMSGLGVVVHLGSGAARNIETAITELSDAGPQTLWFEINSAKPGPNTFETPEKLAVFFGRATAARDAATRGHPKRAITPLEGALKTSTAPVPSQRPERARNAVNSTGGAGGLRLALMVDTAHLWACGVSLAEAGPARRWLAEVAKIGVPIGFHLNDTTTALGSGVDRHATVGDGNIWGGGRTSGLLAVLEFAAKNMCPVIIEGGTAREPIQDIRKLSELAGHTL